ncbi:hypothetical protein [Blastococcus sp. PRF04-17]|uniref:hypothetical protein n=1 Tax=Blastococcus sp. PRF04-17 TaxID=2933797 RepID=UPI001FF100F9|nr:hypothetical protein [Blastococcus sp. PRF04-17]UOY00270.1 hypothetical protein MVA48_14800 [Blastococcus sp. PRF04-17]
MDRHRMAGNFALVDFEHYDIATLTGLDRGEHTGSGPDTFNFIPRPPRWSWPPG